MIGDDRARDLAGAAERLLEECLSVCRITVLPQQHLDYLSVLIDRATGTTCPCRERGTSRRYTSDARAVDGACELQPRVAARTLGHVNATLGQQLHHARGRERVPQVPAHGHQDHVCGPAIAREGGSGPNREVSATASAGEALATMAVMAVTCDDALLAIRAGRHAARRYQHLTTSQTPRDEAVQLGFPS